MGGSLIIANWRVGVARRRHRILKVARTIADLAGEDELKTDHVAEAIQYRTIDKMQ